VQSASPHESQLVEEVLSQSFLDQLPGRLIGDKAYDSDRLDRHLLENYGIELIAPHLSSRQHPTQDGRPLRRYRRRWKIERLFAWLHRLVAPDDARNTIEDVHRTYPMHCPLYRTLHRCIEFKLSYELVPAADVRIPAGS